jgi:hypothetical protein
MLTVSDGQSCNVDVDLRYVYYIYLISATAYSFGNLKNVNGTESEPQIVLCMSGVPDFHVLK